ncbi:T9SS type A sorting domain-containing protein, partial [Nostoc sp. NIES-2111]
RVLDYLTKRPNPQNSMYIPKLVCSALLALCTAFMAQSASAQCSGSLASSPYTITNGKICLPAGTTLSACSTTTVTLTGGAGTINWTLTSGLISSGGTTSGTGSSVTFRSVISNFNKGRITFSYTGGSCPCSYYVDVFKTFTPIAIGGPTCVDDNENATYYATGYPVSGNLAEAIGIDGYSWSNNCSGTLTQISGDNAVQQFTLPGASSSCRLSLVSGTNCNATAATLDIYKRSGVAVTPVGTLPNGSWSNFQSAGKTICLDVNGSNTLQFTVPSFSGATYSWGATGGVVIQSGGATNTATILPITSQYGTISCTITGGTGCTGTYSLNVIRKLANSSFARGTNNRVAVPDAGQIPALVTPVFGSALTPGLEYAFAVSSSVIESYTPTTTTSGWTYTATGNVLYVVPGTTGSWVPSVTTSGRCGNALSPTASAYTVRTAAGTPQIVNGTSGFSLSQNATYQNWPPACTLSDYRYDWTFAGTYTPTGGSTAYTYPNTLANGKVENFPNSISFSNSGETIKLPGGTYSGTLKCIATPATSCNSTNYYTASTSTVVPMMRAIGGPISNGGTESARRGAEASNVLVFPVPSDGVVNIQAPGDMTGSTVSIFGTDGRLISTFDVNATGTLYVSEKLPSGRYNVQVTGPAGTKTSAFVIQ